MKIISKRGREKAAQDFWKWTPGIELETVEKLVSSGMMSRKAACECMGLPYEEPTLAEVIAQKRKEIETVAPELFSNRFKLIRYLNLTDELIEENDHLYREECKLVSPSVSITVTD